MIFNILIDFGIGLIPILGDIADALYRANTRNAWLLETYLVKKAEAQRHGVVQDPDTRQNLQIKPLPAGSSMASDTTAAWHNSGEAAPAGSGNRNVNGGNGAGNSVGDNGGNPDSLMARLLRPMKQSAPRHDEEMAVSTRGNNGYQAAQGVGSHQGQQSGITSR
jgi:hypothetical protein